MRDRECVDALRIPESDQRSILRELEEADRIQPDAIRRRSKRFPYIVREGLTVDVAELSARYIVRPRNISCGGISFLHGSFLHPGRSCVVALKTIDGVELRKPLARPSALLRDDTDGPDVLR